MNSDSLHEIENQRREHLRAIRTLSKEVRRPGEEINRLYYLVLQEYEKEAKVKTFLPILINKRIKQMIEPEPQINGRNATLPKDLNIGRPAREVKWKKWFTRLI